MVRIMSIPTEPIGSIPRPRPLQQALGEHAQGRLSDEELAELQRQVKALGVRFITEPGEALGGGRTVLFRDPEGHELQIVQR